MLLWWWVAVTLAGVVAGVVTVAALFAGAALWLGAAIERSDEERR